MPSRAPTSSSFGVGSVAHLRDLHQDRSFDTSRAIARSFDEPLVPLLNSIDRETSTAGHSAFAVGQPGELEGVGMTGGNGDHAPSEATDQERHVLLHRLSGGRLVLGLGTAG